jgi:hypothetical protein
LAKNCICGRPGRHVLPDFADGQDNGQKLTQGQHKRLDEVRRANGSGGFIYYRVNFAGLTLHE